MKILILGDLFLPKIGGTEIQTNRLATGLTERGHDVEVWTGRWDHAWAVHEDMGFPVHRIETGQALLNRRGLRKFTNLVYMYQLQNRLQARLAEFDVLHAQSLLYGAAVAVRRGLAANVPVLVKETNSGPRSSYRELADLPLGGWMRRRFHQDLRHVAVLNDIAAEEYRGWPFRELAIHPAVNGIVLPELDRRSTSPTLLFVGRWRPEKGIVNLLKAWAKVHETFPAWTLRVVGDGEERATVEALLADPNLARVDVVGYDLDTQPHYRAATAFVLPSLSEGMSNSLLEAMAHGLPCLATTVGASAEMLSDEVGLTCPPGDVDALAQGMARLMGAAPEQHLAWGDRARARVEERYSIAASVARYEAIYQEMKS